MNLTVGKYFIVKHAYWSNAYHNYLLVECINEEFNVVNYKYTETDKLRERTFKEFKYLKLVPASALMEELF